MNVKQMIERLYEFPDELEINAFNSPEGRPRIQRESRRVSAHPRRLLVASPWKATPLQRVVKGRETA